MARIVVVGSLNMDLVVGCARIPKPGETLMGKEFTMMPGGKGANQAYAAAVLGGGDVAMVGRVGEDAFGAELRGNLNRVGVDVSGVRAVPGVASGVAIITVDARGENSIVVAPGANLQWFTEDHVDFAGVSHVLLQLEIPMPTVIRTARLAQAAGAMVILDPAPACSLPSELLSHVDLVTPNEMEAALIGDVGAARLLVKMGKRGSRLEHIVVGAIPVEPIDSTGAGDVYNGALAVGLSEGMDFERAMRFATVASGLSVTKRGAQNSVPTRTEVEAYGFN